MWNKSDWQQLVPLFQNESVQNLWYENKFDLRENESVGRTHFHVKGFARRFVLKKRQKAPQEDTNERKKKLLPRNNSKLTKNDEVIREQIFLS